MRDRQRQKGKGYKMIAYILIFYLLIKAAAPAWTIVLCGVGALLKSIKWGIDLQKKTNE